MKKYRILYAAALGMTALGLILRGGLRGIGIVLVIGGIVLFLAALGYSAYRNARRCPHCGAAYDPRIAALQKKDGMILCHRCGTIVRLDPPGK
ncbi:MAG: hypothetical protein IJX93_03855 [Clostridia bacterium]|nr:hypothetical protein [Clostridia bacterium]MBQ8332889.1 hypothetical protein [Clostridia bacterium]MBQ8512984.1 hypothetical protein [Clostridia bacterium]